MKLSSYGMRVSIIDVWTKTEVVNDYVEKLTYSFLKRELSLIHSKYKHYVYLHGRYRIVAYHHGNGIYTRDDPVADRIRATISAIRQDLTSLEEELRG